MAGSLLLFSAAALDFATLRQVVTVACMVKEVEVVALVEATHLIKVCWAHIELRIELCLGRQSQQPDAQVRLADKALWETGFESFNET